MVSSVNDHHSGQGKTADFQHNQPGKCRHGDAICVSSMGTTFQTIIIFRRALADLKFSGILEISYKTLRVSPPLLEFGGAPRRPLGFEKGFEL
jgi:hypothetical protein